MDKQTAETDRLTGTEGQPAAIIGDWKIIGVNTPHQWVNVEHASGRVACLPWSAVVTLPPASDRGGSDA